MGVAQTEAERARAHCFISGRVQGVFYRANTESKAKELALAGWVKNLDDGRVEAVFEGPRPRVQEAVTWCRQGSPRARVDDVEVSWEEPEGLTGFEVRR